MLIGNILQLYKNDGINRIKAKIIGNNTVQQNDISWSKRILGKDALTHININIIIQLFKPKLKPENNPNISGLYSK